MSTYLMHHGIKGMKWGVRRYQNPDGTLTEAGKERYGKVKTYDSTSFGRRLATGDVGPAFFNTKKRLQNKVDRLNQKADAAAAKGLGEKSDKLRGKAAAQDAANANREAYIRHQSTGKLWAQTLLGAGDFYRGARARGASRVRALGENYANAVILATQNLTIPIGAAVSYAIRRSGNEKSYGGYNVSTYAPLSFIGVKKKKG